MRLGRAFSITLVIALVGAVIGGVMGGLLFAAWRSFHSISIGLGERSMRIIAVGQTPVHTKAEYDAAVSALGTGRALPLVIQTPDGQAARVIIGATPPGRR